MRNELKTRTLIEILMAGFNEMTDENCTNKRVSTEETLAKSPEAEFESSSENVKQPPGKKKKSLFGKTLTRSKPLQAPAPFSTELYCMFVKAIKNGGASYPSSRQLINLKFWSGPGTSHRKRFRRVLPKLRLQRVEGSVVFSANLEEDVLVLEKSRKIILPNELVERAILRAHHYGNNTANEHLPQRTTSLHLGVLKTFQILEKTFTTVKREYGIDLSTVQDVIALCPTCEEFHLVSNCSNSNNTSTNEVDGQHQENGSAVNESPTDTVTFDRQLPSMVIHVPDAKCIWYDQTTIANERDRLKKFLMVISEMRGELGLAARGNCDAKHRFEAKLYCAQMLIKEHSKEIQKALKKDCSPKVFRLGLDELRLEYERSRRLSIFRSHIIELLKYVRERKLQLSPLIVREIEHYIQRLDDEG
ncbi:uncharacterized protein LOC124436946 [Xenia sp. Carnegie-2017]|uniref:uncharacterized protein LOC124436946 n=1 Tax=Xenia sp. Carnegie-2017 TaxID=2897299 RepID=UPI001F04AC40|nr:uncharacterized protein LOC124436946 [Xenia sp. Carnegie-2017]